MYKLTAAATAVLASANAAFAAPCSDPFANQATCTVPEISAMEGAAAIAVLAAIVLLAWERRRRAS